MNRESKARGLADRIQNVGDFWTKCDTLWRARSRQKPTGPVIRIWGPSISLFLPVQVERYQVHCCITSPLCCP